jgi:hypothetical protein
VKSIDFHPDAAQEANDAVDYYDGLRPGLGDDFRVELNAACARIEQNPQLYPVELGSIRVCPLHRFPYPFTTKSWPTGSGWLRSDTRPAALDIGQAERTTDADPRRIEFSSRPAISLLAPAQPLTAGC